MIDKFLFKCIAHKAKMLLSALLKIIMTRLYNLVLKERPVSW